MNPSLRLLIRIQELDGKIRTLQNRSEQIPQQVQNLVEELEACSQRGEKLDQELEGANKERRRLEGEVELLQQKVSRFKGQLMQVKTNKEYRAMVHEIEASETENRQREDRILEQMLHIEDLETKRGGGHRELDLLQKETEKQRRDLEDVGAQSRQTGAELLEEKAQVETELPPNIMDRYQRIASVRDGVALARANGQSCEACHVRLRPQLFTEVVTNEHIIACENCNRILYFSSS